MQLRSCILKERAYVLIPLTLPSFILLLKTQICCQAIFADANKNSRELLEQQGRRILDSRMTLWSKGHTSLDCLSWVSSYLCLSHYYSGLLIHTGELTNSHTQSHVTIATAVSGEEELSSLPLITTWLVAELLADFSFDTYPVWSPDHHGQSHFSSYIVPLSFQSVLKLLLH